ncbi:MAG: phosphate ABC transporter, permease protein PstA [Candidatus Terraquivivens tikiterensis]|uniref:Phosphate transport system permease protein PstA n=1 Tax=Candidatus Terraquivivens tikiterensis TaxID=1980982 RepID=A0A2R7Y5F5_9ARCH|nr:MAG: phosphate ABC transporter, permease protein PstA [Candidatus Terraquivivens tikiterensis]
MSLKKLRDALYTGLAYLSLLLLAVPLAWILFECIVRGGAYILSRPVEFFTDIGRPPGVGGGGIGHAIQGSLYMLGLALLIGVPVGMLAGIYMAERRDSPIAKAARFVSDILVEFPTILVGIVTYAFLVSKVTGLLATGPAAFAASFALAMIMIPIVARSVETAFLTIPNEVREGAYALGLLDRQTVFRVLLPAVRAGVMTAVLIGLAKIAGESAPIIVTNGISNFWFSKWTEPAPSIPVLIYVYGLSPFKEWQAQAWAASLILLLLIMGVGFLARRFTKKMWTGA